MWGRFGRRRTRSSQAIEQATNALENVWGRFGQGSAGRREERAYGSAVWLGTGGVLTVATLILLVFWLLRRRSREPAPTSPGMEEDVEAAPPLVEEEVLVASPGEERSESRGVTPTAHQPREKNRRQARSGPEVSKGR